MERRHHAALEEAEGIRAEMVAEMEAVQEEAAAAAVQAATAAGEAPPGGADAGPFKFTPGKSGASSSEGSLVALRSLASKANLLAAGADDAVAAAAAAATVAAVTHAAAPAPVEAGAASADGSLFGPASGGVARRPPAAQHSARRAHEVSHLKISRFILERVAVQAASRSAQGGATAVTATPNNTVPTVKPTAAPAADAPAPKTD